jgi:AcrR family transcriptional regulator
MRGIAKEVGTIPMAIYRHYENKQALVDALVLDTLNEWSRLVAAIPPGAPLDVTYRARDGRTLLTVSTRARALRCETSLPSATPSFSPSLIKSCAS